MIGSTWRWANDVAEGPHYAWARDAVPIIDFMVAEIGSLRGLSRAYARRYGGSPDTWYGKLWKVRSGRQRFIARPFLERLEALADGR